MITLKKDGIVMGVSTEFEASVFLRRGYVRIDDAEEQTATVGAVGTERAQVDEPEASEKVSAVTEKPKRRRRSTKQAG